MCERGDGIIGSCMNMFQGILTIGHLGNNTPSQSVFEKDTGDIAHTRFIVDKKY